MDRFMTLNSNSQWMDVLNTIGFGGASGATKSFLPKLKNNKESEKLRQKGNDDFKSRNYEMSLKNYTKSLLYAESDSLEMKLALCNRSALLFHKGYYAECLQDIARLFEKGCPEDQKARVIERKKKAQRLLSKTKINNFHGEIPKLETPNPKIPAATSAIKFSNNEKYGTFLQATRDIEIGEVLVVEKPYAFSVNMEYRLQYCSLCGERCFNLIPCDNCFALYCSEECERKAFEDFHEYECVLNRYFFDHPLFNKCSMLRLVELYIGKELDLRLPIRMTLKAFKDLHTNKHNLDGKHHSDCYEEVKRLQPGRASALKLLLNSVYDPFEMRRLYQVLIKFTDIREKFGINEDIFISLLYHNCLIKGNNSAAVSSSRKAGPNNKDDTPDDIGAGLYTVFSRFNHSCCPKLFGVFYGSTLVVRTRNDIKKGEQCFVSYTSTYTDFNRDARQLQLLPYGFTCDCPACLEDWPTVGLDDVDKFCKAATDGDRAALCIIAIVNKFFAEKSVIKKKKLWQTFVSTLRGMGFIEKPSAIIDGLVIDVIKDYFCTHNRRRSNGKSEKESHKMSFPLEIFPSKKSKKKFTPTDTKTPITDIYTVIADKNGNAEEVDIRSDIYRSVSSGSVRSVQSFHSTRSFYSTRSSLRSDRDDDFYSVCSDSSSVKN